MTIHERMIPRTEREKDLLKYGRRQATERIIKLLESQTQYTDYELGIIYSLIALIKGETNG